MSRVFKTVCLLLSLALNAAAESRPETQLQGRPGRGDILLEDFDSYGLRWEPLVDFERATLTITGRQGLVWERRFEAGELLDYELLDLGGVPIPDGSYTYEWRVTTVLPDTEGTLAIKAQSGRFQVDEGVAVALVKSPPDEVFPLLTNLLGNHFEGPVTIQGGGLCVSCDDGERPWVDGVDFTAEILLKQNHLALQAGSGLYKEYWGLTSLVGDFQIIDYPTGAEQGLAYPFTIEDRAPDYSLYIASSGKIGVGTSTPTASLHIERSDGKARLLVKETSPSTEVRTMFELKNNGAPRFALKNRNSGIEWSFQQSGPGNFLISKEGTGGPEVQVYQGGRVRMGPGGTKNFDLDPSGNLFIAGSLTANGSTFPDYVFESDYDLMPLSDLRAYIEQEKRLPDIPSAEEVKKQGGHNMTELQIKLLEKIEELTLYTLEQQERLQEQEEKLQDIESLKRKTAQMEAENARIKAEFAEIRAMLSDQ